MEIYGAHSSLYMPNADDIGGKVCLQASASPDFDNCVFVGLADQLVCDPVVMLQVSEVTKTGYVLFSNLLGERNEKCSLELEIAKEDTRGKNITSTYLHVKLYKNFGEGADDISLHKSSDSEEQNEYYFQACCPNDNIIMLMHPSDPCLLSIFVIKSDEA